MDEKDTDYILPDIKYKWNMSMPKLVKRILYENHMLNPKHQTNKDT